MPSDEKISPALPGVAIATAIVPPLANAGLCLSLGEIHAGLGSFLLFFANFLSILVVASITFILSGMAKRFGAAETKSVDFARRFALPIVAFVFITTFLGHSLVKIAQERKTTKTIRATLISETSRIPSTVLGKVHHYEQEDRIHVMAGVSTPAILTPKQVSRIQDQLTQQIGRQTDLIIHCVLSSSVSAMGSVNNTIVQKLDGTYVKSSGTGNLKDIAITEQTIREYFSTDNSLNLSRVEYVPYGQRRLMLAHVVGLRELTSREIEQLEVDIRKATGDQTIELAVSSLEKPITTAEGTFRYGWFLGNQGTRRMREILREIRADLWSIFDRDAVYDLVNVNQTRLDNEFHILLEITGPEVYPRENIERLQANLAQKYSEPIVLYAWSRIEIVNGPKGQLSIRELNQYFSSRQKENLPEEIYR